jgi:hypothetical protein
MYRCNRGTVLIVVAGIAAMLAAVMMTFLARLRGEADKSRLLVQEAQARVMLSAALMYIQEGARLGWGSEGFGWCDVRDGSLGPRGPVQSDGSIPQPTWWTYGAYPPPAGFPAAPIVPSLRWPAPGSAMQGDMQAWVRPPYAIELTYAYNPVPYEASITTLSEGGGNASVYKDPFLAKAFTAPGAKASLQPQPVASTWTDFQSGLVDATSGAAIIEPTSAGLGWFRVYRETDADRDNDGDPWYDRVAYPPGNNATFIITCGAGATRGYRFWDLPDAQSRALEPVTASESGLFVDETMFNDLLRDSRILWYRVEWSGATGANFNPQVYFDNGGQYRILTAQRIQDSWNDRMPRQVNGSNPISQLGTIKWIQRLDREPPKW